MSIDPAAGAAYALLRQLSSSAVPPSELIARLNREGDLLPGTFAVTGNTSAAFNSGNLISGQGTIQSTNLTPNLPVPGRAYFLASLQPFASANILARLLIGNSSISGAGTSPQTDQEMFLGPNMAKAIDLNIFVRNQDAPSLCGLYVKQFLDTTPTTVYVGGSFMGWTLADDLNFNAAKSILWISDSRGNGSAGLLTSTQLSRRVRNYYRAKGIDCRYILKAYSGSTTSGHATYIAEHKYTFDSVALIVYDLGTNDQPQGLSTATSMANLQAAIAWKQAIYPKAKMMVIGSPPAEASANETSLAAFRAAAVSYIVGLADPNVLFFTEGGAFDSSVTTNYMSSDTAGSRVHPSDQGLNFIWNGGYQSYVGMKAWLDANMPTI